MRLDDRQASPANLRGIWAVLASAPADEKTSGFAIVSIGDEARVVSAGCIGNSPDHFFVRTEVACNEGTSLVAGNTVTGQTKGLAKKPLIAGNAVAGQVTGEIKPKSLQDTSRAGPPSPGGSAASSGLGSRLREAEIAQDNEDERFLEARDQLRRGSVRLRADSTIRINLESR